jgi:hypothetical protein
MNRRSESRSYRPVASPGPAIGVAVGALALTCVVALLLTAATTPSAATRLACAAGAAAGIVVLVTAALGTWWCATLRYALGPAALELRYGSRLLRLRYDEIDGVLGRGSDERSRAPTLWPGAHFGRGRGPGGAFELWRSTSSEPGRLVVVSAGGSGYILTPVEANSFREQVIEQARAATYIGSDSGSQRWSWLDLVARFDGWVRALLLVAGVVATAGIAADVARYGSSQRDGLSAASVLLANAMVALPVSVRWPLPARLLAAGALAAQLFTL